ncbi:MAG: serine/threonine-protein phosphatase [bacterium]|nr:serine/threonine-protein phosphatase [bacterium]
MQKILNKIISFLLFLPGSKEKFPIEQRIFNSLALLITAFTVMATMLNLGITVNPLVTISTGILSICIFGVYLYSRISRQYKTFIIPLVFTVYCILVLQWFLNAGTGGAVQYTYFLGMPLSLILIKRNYRVFILLLYTITIIILVTIEYFFPNLLQRYVSPMDRLVDIVITFGSIMLLSGSGIFLLLANYRGLHRELEKNNAKLLKRREEIENDIIMAQKIQQQFIPAFDPTYFIHALYKPMEHVGGDYYDFIKFRDPDLTGIFICDVSGRGVPAAFITSMIKSNMQHAGTKREDPAELLMYLNHELFDITENNSISAFYGIFNAQTGELRYSNAGHPPPLILSHKSIDHIVGKMGPPLALTNNQGLEKLQKTYVASSVTIPFNSKLLFFTDGLTKATSKKNAAERFEDSKMKRVLITSDSLDCTEFVHRVFRELVIFRGSENFSDDICIICVDVNPPHQEQ